MKKEIHPEYRKVVFVDTSSGQKYLCGSTIKADDTCELDGKTYDCVKVSISSSTHPFFTGKTKFVDTEGRVDKFNKRYAKKEAGDQGKQQKEEKNQKQPEKKEKKPAPKKAAAPKKAESAQAVKENAKKAAEAVKKKAATKKAEKKTEEEK